MQHHQSKTNKDHLLRNASNDYIIPLEDDYILSGAALKVHINFKDSTKLLNNKINILCP